MRDGTLLSTVVYLPGRNPTGRFPVVIDRSPYGHTATELLALLFCPLGFAAVMQDMRGSGASEGEFAFWRTDGSDTFDTLAWIEAQGTADEPQPQPRLLVTNHAVTHQPPPSSSPSLPLFLRTHRLVERQRLPDRRIGRWVTPYPTLTPNTS